MLDHTTHTLPTAAIINIGDELLIGQVVNSNAATMGQMLTRAGFDVRHTLVVGDNAHAIRSAIEDTDADVLLLTGGLGPTKDDITKHLLSELFHSELVENAEALDNVRRIFAARGFELTDINRQQAWVPRCCRVLNNDLGTAPCLWFDRPGDHGHPSGRVLVSLPGVPFEMEWLMSNRVMPALQQHFHTGHIVNHNVLVEGIGESFLSDLIEPWEVALPACIRLAYLPEAGMVKLRLTARGENRPELDSALQSALHGLRSIAHPYIVGEGHENVAQLVHHLLLQHNMRLAVAESCTGGTIASRLTAIPGASAYLVGDVVAYSNQVKMQQLGVQQATLDQYGAVSEPTAAEMAEGVRLRLGADIGISTTGVAGPDGGTDAKPVGTVCFGISTAQSTTAHTMHFGSRRQQNIDRAVNHALAALARTLGNQQN